MKRPRPSLEDVRHFFRYDATSGKIFWAVDWYRCKAGDEYGCANYADGNAHRIGMFKRRYIHAHILIWFYVHGTWPRDQLDHRDGDGLNNRIENLREATCSQNMKNRRKSRTARPLPLGVCFAKSTGKYQANIKVNNRSVYLGQYKTSDEASRVYQAAAEKQHLDFASHLTREDTSLVHYP